jgi:hypothetical protein
LLVSMGNNMLLCQKITEGDLVVIWLCFSMV